MQGADLLLTIAEVAVAFAGFASLVGILGQQSARDDPRVLGVRMRGMILFSLAAVAFSLIPIVLQRYSLDDASVWRLSSALLAASFVAMAVWLVSAIVRLRSLSLPRRRFAVPGIAGTLASAFTVGTALLGFNALRPAPSEAAYVTGLLLLLFLAGFAFTLILSSFLPSLDS